MRERILRRVVLPAPLRPMRPRTSPSFTSSETSLSAQNVSSFFRRSEASGERRNASIEWRRPSSTCKPRRYSLPSPSPWMTVLDIVGTFERWNGGDRAGGRGAGAEREWRKRETGGRGRVRGRRGGRPGRERRREGDREWDRDRRRRNRLLSCK